MTTNKINSDEHDGDRVDQGDEPLDSCKTSVPPGGPGARRLPISGPDSGRSDGEAVLSPHRRLSPNLPSGVAEEGPGAELWRSVVRETIQPYGPNSEAVEVDVHGPNPLVEYIRSGYGGSPWGGEPPSMFASGDRPPFIASGESPDLLRRVRYELRHTAAMTESKALLFDLLEVSADTDFTVTGIDPERLMTDAGKRAFNDYAARVWRWATAGPAEKVSYTPADFDALFGKADA